MFEINIGLPMEVRKETFSRIFRRISSNELVRVYLEWMEKLEYVISAKGHYAHPQATIISQYLCLASGHCPLKSCPPTERLVDWPLDFYMFDD
jgi:hypothetical protein